MAEDRIRILEERLTRLEATLAQRPSGGGSGGFTPPSGVIVDSAPYAGGQWGYYHRPIPSPVVDPAPWPYPGGWGRPRWPTPVVDPGPFPTPVVDPAPWPTPIVDPAVFAQSLAALGRIRPVGGDPPPPDFSRLSVSQLEATLHSISAERARLDGMEAMVKKQIEATKKQPG
jgi:hypothetical protein